MRGGDKKMTRRRIVRNQERIQLMNVQERIQLMDVRYQD